MFSMYLIGLILISLCLVGFGDILLFREEGECFDRNQLLGIRFIPFHLVHEVWCILLLVYGGLAILLRELTNLETFVLRMLGA